MSPVGDDLLDVAYRKQKRVNDPFLGACPVPV